MAIIQSGNSGDLLRIDTTTKAARVALYSRQFYGTYHLSANSGIIAASTAADSILFTLKNTSTNLFLIRRILVGMQVTTAYTKGNVRLAGYIVRTNYTAQGTTAATTVNLTGNNGKKRTSFPSPTINVQICTTTTISGENVGSNEDITPFAQTLLDLRADIGTSPVSGLVPLYDELTMETPFILEANEGIRIKNRTVFPASGSGHLIVDVDYDEILTSDL